MDHHQTQGLQVMHLPHACYMSRITTILSAGLQIMKLFVMKSSIQIQFNSIETSITSVQS